MINFVALVAKKILSSIEYNLMLLVIVFALLYTAVNYTHLEYSNMFIKTIVNKNVLIAIIFPCFIFITYQVLNYINISSNLIMRTNSKLNLLKQILKSIIAITFVFFIEIMLITLIICNIIEHLPFSLGYYLGYDILDLFVIVVSIFKLYFTILSISFLEMVTFLKFQNKSLSIIIPFVLSGSLYFLPRFITYNIFIDIFNPSFHYEGYMFSNSILELILTGVIYFTGIYSILISLMKKFIKEKDFNI